MQRRSALKSLLFFAGGIAILPSYSIDPRRASILLNSITITSDQEKLLGEICEAFVPETDTPGGKSLGLHLFVMKMLDDLHEKNDQERFIKGLDQLEKYSKKQYGKSLIKLNQVQREKVLEEIENKNGFSEEVDLFYTITKRRTIQGYLNSKYVMTKLRVYELVPARYNGYFPVRNTN